MKEYALKYGCNPNQAPACLRMADGSDLPVRVLWGRPGYINFLDALNGYQLVRELKGALGLPAATSFKHVSPAGAAVGLPIEGNLRQVLMAQGIEGFADSPLAWAYARARGTDRMSSFGDFIALSDVCDMATARFIAREVSDGIIAPGYEPGTLEVLAQKKKGAYAVIEIDPAYEPAALETKQVFGVTFAQGRNEAKIGPELLGNVVTAKKEIPEEARRDLVLALITLKYTQSNSVCYAKDGQTVGVGAGQQSRIHCTRLAGSKADTFFLRSCEKALSLPFLPDLGRPRRDTAIDLYLGEDWEDVLGEGKWQAYFSRRPEPVTPEEKRAFLAEVRGVSLASDAFFPFGDNIHRAARSGVGHIAQPGGSVRDADVIAACDEYGIAMAFTGLRLFHH